MSQFILKDIQKEEQLGSVVIKSLKDVNLEFEKGQFYSLVGPEGAGKSKILNILSFSENPSAGTFLYNNRNVRELEQREINHIRANNIGYIPQIVNLNLTISAIDNVSMVSKILGEENVVAREKAEFWLKQVGLGHKINATPLELDYLEFKKIGIARAMIKKPEILLADDIYYKINPVRGRELLELLLKLNKEHKVTVVQTARNAELAKSSTIYTIQDGVTSQPLTANNAA